MHRLPLRLGVAGCGQVFEACHLPAILAGKNWHWVAACEPLADRRHWLRAQYHWVEWVATYEGLLNRQDVDALLIASPPPLHLPQLRRALKYRLAVLVEKPLGVSAATLPDLPLSATAAARVQIGFNRRFKRAYQKLRAYLKRTPRGDIRSIEVILCHDARRWPAVSGYLQNDARGGGLWDDVLSHQIDLAHWLVGQPVVAARVDHAAWAGQSPTQIYYTLEFADGLAANCLAGHRHAFEELVAVHLNRHILLAWPDGLIRMQRRMRPLLRTINRAGTFMHLARCRLVDRPSESAASYRRQLAAFAGVVREDMPWTSEAAGLADGIDNIKIIQTCRRSLAAGGQAIRITPEKGAA
jgi:predicted dehydrogenase